jgi:hypothetical protein
MFSILKANCISLISPLSMATTRPFIVIVPGACQSPAHYGFLSHLLQLAGYPVLSALLPSVGAAGKVTVDNDTAYIRDRMLMPVLDHEEHDVIMLMNSYSSVLGGAAAKGLSKKAERAAQGMKMSVIGQIYLAAILAKGRDGNDILGAFGGHYPPHITPYVSDYSSEGVNQRALKMLL